MTEVLTGLIKKLEPTAKYLSTRGITQGCMGYCEDEDLDQIAYEVSKAHSIVDQFFTDYRWGMGASESKLLSEFLNDVMTLIRLDKTRDPLKSSALAISFMLSTLVNDLSAISRH